MTVHQSTRMLFPELMESGLKKVAQTLSLPKIVETKKIQSNNWSCKITQIPSRSVWRMPLISLSNLESRCHSSKEIVNLSNSNNRRTPITFQTMSDTMFSIVILTKGIPIFRCATRCLLQTMQVVKIPSSLARNRHQLPQKFIDLSQTSWSS